MSNLTPRDVSDHAGGVAARTAREVWVYGVVQGVGFRPFVYNLARRLGISGWVRNTSAGVQMSIEGATPLVDGFLVALRREAPPRASLTAIEATPVEPTGADRFTILESAADSGAYQLVSPDISLCDDCRRELLDPADRRFRYPFINCTNCGPRFTIIEALPYDRERTTMRRFSLCPACRREYEDPGDRRFHAEPNACPVCGPRVWLKGASEVHGSSEAPEAAIVAAAELLRRGSILALKGLGGFHIACDATDGDVVRELKRRKGRPHKPLAVMFANLEQLGVHCHVSAEEAALLESPEHPIVLLQWRRSLDDRSAVHPEVAVRQRYLGAMLPYTPLHLLLLQEVGRPLVMTSGNLAEEPIVKDWEEASRLAGIPDASLLHDRDIRARYDDSVTLVRRGRPRLVRRSRGYAPLPIQLPDELPQVLACGAELKNTFCMTRRRDAFLSQHIGDLENLETLEHYEASIDLYEQLFRLRPEVIAYDLHPEYLATKYGLERAARTAVPRIGVQHHHAHVAACMAENGRCEPVIGVSMDGLGYGTDGTLWGGEVLLCDYSGFYRAAHLESLPLPGGALAIRRPVRTAAGWLLTLLGEDGLRRGLAAGLALAEMEEAALRQQLTAKTNAPLTSSCGRLFDAVAALAGLRAEVTYEGQAAIELEMVSEAGGVPYAYSVDGPLVVGCRELGGGHGSPAVVRLARLLAGVLEDLEAGRSPGFVGSRLHATLAAVVRDLCCGLREAGGPRVVALSGGVFQNRLLTELCESVLEEAGFTVLTHALVPSNDGGLALGQAVVAGYTSLGAVDAP